MTTSISLVTSTQNYLSNFQTSSSKKLLGENFIRHLFFPLCSAPSERSQRKLEENRVKVENFWTNSLEDTCYPAAKRIRETFNHETIKVPVHVNGKKLTVSVEVIETKPNASNERVSHQECYQMALGLPNLATVNTYIDGVYPFLTEYLRKQDVNPNLPPARFFLISAYDTTYTDIPEPHNIHHADSLDESGLIFARTLQELANNYNKIHFLLVHSASVFRLAYAANYGVDIGEIFVDRGSSSIDELCKIYLMGKMGLMPLARWCGWDVDVGHRITAHLSHKKDTHITIFGVKSDARFPGAANLCEHDRIREAAGLPLIPKKQQLSLLKVMSLALGALGIYNNMPVLVMTAQIGVVFGNQSSKETKKTDWVAKLTFLYLKICDKKVSPNEQHIMSLDNFRSEHLHESSHEQNILFDDKTLSESLFDRLIPTSK
jgi:hypothetical protein